MSRSVLNCSFRTGIYQQRNFEVPDRRERRKMSFIMINIYQDKETEQRIESNQRFSHGFPLEAEIEEQMRNMTLQQIGEQLTKQFSERGAVGVSLIELRFSMTFNPKEEKENQ